MRPERQGDAEPIRAVTALAFAGMPYSDGSESEIASRLRDAGALSVSLVADSNGEIIGHIAFSQVHLSDGSSGWFGLGPLAVSPRFQRRGVGSALVEAGLAWLQELQAAGCVVLGDPAYYGRFGFQADTALRLSGFPAEHFQALVLKGSKPDSATVQFHSAFGC